MEHHLHPTDVVILLQTHAFDLQAQVDAAGRCARDIQEQVAIVKEPRDEDARADALHAIRSDAARLLGEHDGLCATVREMQALAALISPERRRTVQFVMWDRRRRA